ncbi:MAG: hypothetical protein NXH75_07990 [Halobacteriovoraceae bacterium]|nr:hypothetical protein [Halobacteriovoraceae bacterium]
MSFDSLAFAIFFITLLPLFHKAKGTTKLVTLLASSYLFYSSINLLFLPLILVSTLIDYFCGIGIEKKSDKKKVFLIISIFLNLSLLFFFKYYTFAANNINLILAYFNSSLALPHFKIEFPVGISFYTLQTIGYTVDVYRSKTKVEKNFFRFALFVCFFPQLIAGPLERASKLLPQIKKPMELNYFLAQKYTFYIFLGLVKKTVVSDRIYDLIKRNLDAPAILENSSKNIITFYMMFYRLYYDFSAYSIMAVGIAGLIGIQLSYNFKQPAFSTNIADFWRRWHITLHDWLKDYIFKPLLERKVYPLVAVVLVFLTSGLWHGAAWNFILWGGLNAFYFIIYKTLIKPFLKGKSWAETKTFKVISCIFLFHLITMTAPFYFINEIGPTLAFIRNGFEFKYFNYGDFLKAMSAEARIDFYIIVAALFILEAMSLRCYLKDYKVENFAHRKVFLNGIIITLFLIVFLFSKESGPLFRYYFF